MLNPVATHSLLAELHADVRDTLGARALDRLRIQRAVLGIFFTGVQLDNGVGGLCATPIKGVPEAVCCPSSALAMPVPGRIAGRSAAEVLQDLYRPQDLRRALAIATLNALAETLWQHDGPPPGARVVEGDAFDALAIALGQRVALVGAFPPYLRALRRSHQPFHVLELDPTTLKPEELPFYAPADRAPEIVAQADVLITTGTTLVNGTLDDLLSHLRPGAQAAVVGPTATLRAAPFARRGATVVGGTRVLAAAELLDLLAEGGSGYHFFGKSVERICLCL
ncbi:Rossmann-like domain-containing protein [Comamonas nitrativorans]|uniref:Rossmann-like domain-containing protein n=1 Tax=Comamonas nitrativorans TaxID=108437 RepID=A0ABV9GT60_9BURK